MWQQCNTLLHRTVVKQWLSLHPRPKLLPPLPQKRCFPWHITSRSILAKWVKAVALGCINLELTGSQGCDGAFHLFFCSFFDFLTIMRKASLQVAVDVRCRNLMLRLGSTHCLTFLGDFFFFLKNQCPSARFFRFFAFHAKTRKPPWRSSVFHCPLKKYKEKNGLLSQQKQMGGRENVWLPGEFPSHVEAYDCA